MIETEGFSSNLVWDSLGEVSRFSQGFNVRRSQTPCVSKCVQHVTTTIYHFRIHCLVGKKTTAMFAFGARCSSCWGSRVNNRYHVNHTWSRGQKLFYCQSTATQLKERGIASSRVGWPLVIPFHRRQNKSMSKSNRQ